PLPAFAVARLPGARGDVTLPLLPAGLRLAGDVAPALGDLPAQGPRARDGRRHAGALGRQLRGGVLLPAARGGIRRVADVLRVRGGGPAGGRLLRPLRAGDRRPLPRGDRGAAAAQL